VVTAADEDSVIAVAVVPGQAHDAPQLEPLLRETLARIPLVDELVADKGFDSDDLRRACLDRDVMPQIPCRANRTDPVEVYPDAAPATASNDCSTRPSNSAASLPGTTNSRPSSSVSST
jgi:hypothetical protein